VRVLCRACSEAHVDAEGPDAPSWRPHRHVGLAVPPALAGELLAEWVRGGPARSHGEPLLAF
jgi:hypothetical protein